MSEQSDPATKGDLSHLESKFDNAIQKIDALAGVINEIGDNQTIGNLHQRDLKSRVEKIEKIHHQGRYASV